MSQFDQRAPELIKAEKLSHLTLAKDVMYQMSDVKFWIAAGVPWGVLPYSGDGRYTARLMPEMIFHLVIGLCGPTARTAAMLRVWIACMFGWNRKQIVFLRRCPIVLRTTTAVGLSNMTFYEEFKNRAGHNVLAAIEDGAVLRGGIAEKAIDAWKNAGGAMTKDDAWRLETPGSSIIAALDDYETMANAVRKFDVDGSCADYFFICLTRNDGISIHSQMEISHFGDLFPKGTNFQAIRKTAQLIQFTKVGSATAQIASSGHSSARTLMKYYLNTKDFRNGLDSSIRFLQNCLAANVVVKGGFEDRLEVPAEIIKWFANFSRLCGLEAVARERDPLELPHKNRTGSDFCLTV
ncbi:hypothetical protein [Pararhizobium sp. DWP1-1-3]|uniref:hypothetical protein n=1 Tax=Pararhizobium sp. DWP1-1-3 TaxID=2804652 RepID=UPI003CEE02CD